MGGSRFNDGTRGAWYCALDRDATIAEVAYYQIRRMDRFGYGSGTYKGNPIFQELLARLVGLFYDARGLPCDRGVLGTDPEASYPSARKLARKVIMKGGRGVINLSVRRALVSPSIRKLFKT